MSNRARPKTLVEARELRGLTSEVLAEKMGLTRPAISAWENGRSVPIGSSRLLLAIVLNFPPEVVESWFEETKRAVGAAR